MTTLCIARDHDDGKDVRQDVRRISQAHPVTFFAPNCPKSVHINPLEIPHTMWQYKVVQYKVVEK
jgi:hypothetical protein